MAKRITEQVWDLVHQQMPLHGCGQRLRPGWGIGQTVAVCPDCSYVAVIDTEWMAQAVANAWAQTEKEQG